MSKIRLDLLLLEQKLASTRTKAHELVVDGHVLVDGLVCRKPGEKFTEDAVIVLVKEEHPYVSRGGVKLAAALAEFKVSAADKVVLDVGISTGGFTDCLLRDGAKKIFGIDVGTGQLAERLKSNPRLVLFESTHIKDLEPSKIGVAVNLLVADLSFISLKKVIPFFRPFLGAGAELILLVKPQFELDQKSLGSGGIVRNIVDRGRALEGVQHSLRENGYLVKGSMESPITGGDGNIESFLHAVLGSLQG